MGLELAGGFYCLQKGLHFCCSTPFSGCKSTGKKASLSMLRMSFNLSLPTHSFGNETLMELFSSATMHPHNSKYVIKNNL